jgi:hypothetical protein
MPKLRCLPLLLAFAVALIPAVGEAKAPSKKDVDEALLRLSADQLGAVRTAETELREGERQLAQIQTDQDVAFLDSKAARSWVDASEAIVRAIKADQKAAEKGNRTEQLASLAAQMVRTDAALAWRKARHDATKEAVSLEQARVTWAKSELERLKLVLDVARMEAYEVSVGGDPEVQEEVGKLRVKLGRAGQDESRDRGKVDRARAKWQEAAARAETLDPAGDPGQ